MERGVVYSTAPNPTVNAERIVIGSGVGTYDSTTDLSLNYPHLFKPNTNYYVRAYAITENNISAYGNEVSFTTLPVGQTGSGGGIVFFDKGNTIGGWRYLEVAPNDQSTGIQWGCSGTSIPGTKLSIGSGEANTGLIVTGCKEASFAAKLCDNLTLGGQSDWFLPTIDEINLMYINLYLNGKGNFSTLNYYWTSGELDSSLARFFRFIDRSRAAFPKSETLYVRAVRAF